MTPEKNGVRLLNVTRARGKMLELGLDELAYAEMVDGDNPAALFLLTIGILGDYAAAFCDRRAPTVSNSALQFSARFFDAFLESRLTGALSQDLLILGASAYYLAERPGSSYVLARRLAVIEDNLLAEEFLCRVLQANWSTPLPRRAMHELNQAIGTGFDLLALYFQTGAGLEQIDTQLQEVRRLAYEKGASRELLFLDIAAAVVAIRLRSSSWRLLPEFSGLSSEKWGQVVRKAGFPTELWPAQIMLGTKGIFRGASGLIQMPTSAGKTRALEIILRSAFLADRARIAIVVVPFRALCHEITTSLRKAFEGEDVRVNELSDALQMDFHEQIAELLGNDGAPTQFILALTPEKLLYVLRQQPILGPQIGLVAYDEGHQFDSGARGIVYELLLTEIRALLSATTQVILISAVIKNSTAVARWLIGAEAVVVDGATLYPTERSVAFASWAEEHGQLMFFDSGHYLEKDYSVAKAIEQRPLRKFSKGEKQRYFPERTSKQTANDVSLYLGIALAQHGAAAIFCGLKATASNMAERIVEIYERGYDRAPPVSASDPHEVQAMLCLIDAHFGRHSTLYRAAQLGAFVHHNGTPQGLRLAIEHGVQTEKLRLVVCTSTLAQGVNLPIRYLIVSSMYQAGELIKTRDFLNLVGRAGRAGMHTEGLVVFSDPRALDEKEGDSWKFEMAVNLLAPSKAEDTSSSLLEIISPLVSENGKRILVLPDGVLAKLLTAEDDLVQDWARRQQRVGFRLGFTEKGLISQLRKKKKLLVAVESYLMANRRDDTFEHFQARVSILAQETLAYSLATERQKTELLTLFSIVAEFIERIVPLPAKQAGYAKTLLGARTACGVERWVEGRREQLTSFGTGEEWLRGVWPLFAQISDDKFFHTVLPLEVSAVVAQAWMEGAPYKHLIAIASGMGAKKPWGKGAVAVSAADVVDFCEGTLSFDCSLLVAAVVQFLFGFNAANDEGATSLLLFQKSLKYGLPDRLSVSIFEKGLADRVVAQEIANVLRANGYLEEFVGTAFLTHREHLTEALNKYPTYFQTTVTQQ